MNPMVNNGTSFSLKSTLIFCFLFSVHVDAQNWPMANGCKERTSWASVEDELLPPLEKRMEFSLSEGIASGISFYKDMLFVSVEADPNRLVAFDVLSGSEVWQFVIPNSGGAVNVTPAVNDSLVLCGGQGGPGLYALDRFTGAEKWFKGVGSLYSNNPIIDGIHVYVVADSLYCLDISDGTTIWSYPLSGSISPAVDDEMLYICGYRILLAFNKLNGEIIWQMENSQKYYSSVTVNENYLYTYHYDSVMAVDKNTSNVEWSYPIPDGRPPEMSLVTMAINDSFLCFPVWEDSTGKGQLYTLDRITGNYLWHHTFDSAGVYPSAIANGIVYTVNWKAYAIWGFDLNTGQAVFFDDSEKYLGQPIAADGRLLTGTYGKVVTFNNEGTGLDPIPVIAQASPELLQNWPNPFRQSTNIHFGLDQPGHVDMAVYDLTGRRVKIMAEGKFVEGTHTLTWDGTGEGSRKVPPGIYMLRLSTGNRIRTISMILIR